jgi:hypothetical protein
MMVELAGRCFYGGKVDEFLSEVKGFLNYSDFFHASPQG